MSDLALFKCPYIPTLQIYQIADDFYRKYWDKKNLPVDVELIAEKIGLVIIPEYVIDTIDAYLKLDTKGIIINAKTYMDPRYINRLRFSMAHELGHYVLHRTVIRKLKLRTIDDYIQFIEETEESEYSKFEFQANEFAGRLLVPPQALRSEVAKIYNTLQNNKLINMLKEDPDQILARVSPTLCKPFGVSEQTIEIRVKREKLWPPG